MELETHGWSELFSDKLMGLDDRLEIEGKRGGRSQVLLQLPDLL